MKNGNNNERPKELLLKKNVDEPEFVEKRPPSRTIFVSVLLLSGCWIIFSLALYQFRNSNKFEVASRFVKNNENIQLEVGEILQISDANSDALADRYEELKRRSQNGEGLANMDNSQNKEEPTIIYSGDKSETAYSVNVKGSKKTIEVIVNLWVHNFSDNQVANHYTINKAKYEDEKGIRKEIPVGFLENYLLLFKK